MPVSDTEWNDRMTDEYRLQKVGGKYGDIARIVYDFLYDGLNAYSLNELYISALGRSEMDTAEVSKATVSEVLDELVGDGLVDAQKVATTEGMTWHYRVAEEANLPRILGGE